MGHDDGQRRHQPLADQGHTCPAAVGRSHKSYLLARSMYFLSDLSTRMTSPRSMNTGTCTTKPVSNVAGLVVRVAVAPLMPGSVSTTSRSTVIGRSMLIALPS